MCGVKATQGIKNKHTLDYLPECLITQLDKFRCFHFNLGARLINMLTDKIKEVKEK